MALYFAYGSNMNPEQMTVRCPGSRSLGAFTLPKARLVFRMVADCVEDAEADCRGVLYEITNEDEARLDEYEGIAAGTYFKDHFLVRTPEGERKVLIYRMNSDGIFPPTENYYRRIVEGYRAAGLKLAPLRAAKDHAWEQRSPSFRERQRYARQGRPTLAQPSSFASNASVVPVAPGSDTPWIQVARVRKTKRLADPAEVKPDPGNDAEVVAFDVNDPTTRPEFYRRANGLGDAETNTVRHHKPKRKNLADWLADKSNRS